MGKKLKPVKKLGSGLKAAIIGVVFGIILTFLINFMVEVGWLPDFAQPVFSVVSIIGNILTLTKMRSWGIFYTVGWLSGSFLFMGMMSTTDLVLNIVVPILIFLIRFVLWVKQLSLSR